VCAPRNYQVTVRQGRTMDKEAQNIASDALMWAEHDRDEAQAEVARLSERVTMLEAALDRDKTGLAKGLSKVLELVAGYWWITEGRGSYSWDDDRYRDETGNALSDIRDAATQALRDSGTLANNALCVHAERKLDDAK